MPGGLPGFWVKVRSGDVSCQSSLTISLMRSPQLASEIDRTKKLVYGVRSICLFAGCLRSMHMLLACHSRSPLGLGDRLIYAPYDQPPASSKPAG